MSFKFYPKESRLYDFLKLPRLVFYREGYEDTKDDQNFKELATEHYINFIKKVEHTLKPYVKEIEIFYAKAFLSEYDFIDLITKANSIIGYESEQKYLDMLLTLSEHDINRSIVYSILIGNRDYHNYSEEIMEKAEEISLNKDELISFIKDLPIEAATKWNLFVIVDEPTVYMKRYVELMISISPIFETIYRQYENEVCACGQNLVELLNKSGSKGLEEITYSILDSKIIDAKEVNILISVIFSYAISLMSVGKDNYVVWGIKMEEAFKEMKEINENKTNERVQIFKNLGDKTRYEVLKLIASGESSTKEIAKSQGVSSATISYHLNNLLTSKTIKLDKSDNKYGYVVDYELLEETIKGFKEDIKFPQS